jgi:large subunit ribosomal protein L6
MSRIGKKPVEIPQGVKVDQQGQLLKVSGPQGSLELLCHERVTVKVDAAQHRIDVLNPEPENRQCRELHGTTRALIANMVAGVSKGYEKKMEIYGTGYSVKEQSGTLVLQVGFAHAVEVPIPKAVKVAMTFLRGLPSDRLTRRAWVSLRRTSGRSGRLSRIRAKASGTQMSRSGTRSARRSLQARRN